MKTEIVMNGHLSAKFTDLIICAHLRDLIVRSHVDVRVSVEYETHDYAVFMSITIILTGEREEMLLEAYGAVEKEIVKSLERAIAELRVKEIATEFGDHNLAVATM